MLEKIQNGYSYTEVLPCKICHKLTLQVITEYAQYRVYSCCTCNNFRSLMKV